jgi:DNA repair exonuclease SbcCD nuclease subunit/ABC-type Na+ transport system ATPase subunit NatA
MKFAHLADTHIRNLKYHYEYRVIFEQIYDKLREEKVDYIIHCGDLAHTKTQLSPEYFEMASNFLKNLADIAPTYIIPGNHDGNLRNSSRQDAITPIVEALEHPNLSLLKDSGETPLNDKFTLNVLSVFDEDNWAKSTDEDSINIAVYHGSISGVKTDLGWTMEHGENDVSIFDEFDFAFLGDIHKTNQILDHDGRIRYPGSTIQQNHGESNDKGLLIWNIRDRDDFDVEHVSFINPKPFITVNLTPKGRIPNKTSVPEGARLRLVSNNNLSLDVLKKAVDVAKAKFKPESVTFLNRASGDRTDISDSINNIFQENLRDSAVQKRLIKDYLKDYDPTEEIAEKVLELNKKYNSAVEEDEEVARNINWKLKSIEWDNLFNYGESNKINFENLNGVVGIFGKNFSGKSSVIDSLLYTLYNSTSKNNRKNLHLINQTKDNCRGKAEITVGHNIYEIERISEKYEKKLHGNTTVEAKTDIEFSKRDEVIGENISLNGLSRNDTDKNIRKMFGTMDDFLFTSMASQLGSLMFISEGSTRRKEILAKFLDLEMFERKFKLAKDDASDLRGMLKRLEGTEFDEQIKEVNEKLFAIECDIKKQENSCEQITENIDIYRNKVEEVNERINIIPVEIIDIDEVEKSLEHNKKEKDLLIGKSKKFFNNIKNNKELLSKIESFLNDDFDIEDIKSNKSIVVERQNQLNLICNDIKVHEAKLKVKEGKAALLEEVPCGEEFSHCKFIKDAYGALRQLDEVKREIDDLRTAEEETFGEIKKLNPEKIEEHIEKYDKLLEKQNEINSENSSYELEIEKSKTKIVGFQKEVEQLNKKVIEYNKNKLAIENLEALNFEKDNFLRAIVKEKENLSACQNRLIELSKEHGSIEQALKNLEDDKQELHDLREEYAAYDLFMRCMHSNGIAYDIIKKRLPIINAEVAKVLANIVDFEVFFEAEDKKLEIFIKHPKFDARPIELGSGSEKTIAAMAIRLALLNVSSLPKPDLFILDEPATALDEENMEGFIRILDMVKSYFKTVLLISHLDTLKDCADMTIEIEKKGNFAYVNY